LYSREDLIRLVYSEKIMQIFMREFEEFVESLVGGLNIVDY